MTTDNNEAISYHASRDGPPPCFRPGYMAIAMLAAAALQSPEVNASTAAFGCVADHEQTIQISDEISWFQQDFHRNRVDDAFQRLEQDPLGATLVAAAEQHGVRINHVASDHLLPEVSRFLPEANTIWIADNLPTDDLPAIIGRELFIMQGFHEGTGAAATLMDASSIYPGKGSFAEASLRESAAAWTVAAHLGFELGFSLDPQGVSEAYYDALVVYQKHSKGTGVTQAMNRSIGEMRGKLMNREEELSSITVNWDRASTCRDVAFRNETAPQAHQKADQSVRHLLGVMAEIEGVPSLPYPRDDHQAFLAKNGDVVVLQWDGEHGAYMRANNPYGAAMLRGGEEVYALNGKLLTHEEWMSDPTTDWDRASYAQRQDDPGTTGFSP